AQRQAREDGKQRNKRNERRQRDQRDQRHQRNQRNQRNHGRQRDQPRGPAPERLHAEQRRAARDVHHEPGNDRKGVVHRRPTLRHRRLHTERRHHHGQREHRLERQQL